MQNVECKIVSCKKIVEWDIEYRYYTRKNILSLRYTNSRFTIYGLYTLCSMPHAPRYFSVNSTLLAIYRGSRRPLRQQSCRSHPFSPAVRAEALGGALFERKIYPALL
jgi:hypothetical protein